MTNRMPKLLLASANRGKIREYRSLLENLGYEIVTLADEGITTIPVESGDSYEQNATLKATTCAQSAGFTAVADDSGLEVDALNGEPGVYSARFAGKGATDADRVRTLLARLKGVPWEKRSAHFKCVIAIATPKGVVTLCSGECHGVISLEPRGESGFGYDPVFYLPEMDKTMAELPMETKNEISHRARACQKARPELARLIDDSKDE